MAFARYPQTVAGTPSKPPLGGIAIGVNNASEKKDKAWKAIQCLTNAEHQKAYMLGTGNPAARRSATPRSTSPCASARPVTAR